MVLSFVPPSSICINLLHNRTHSFLIASSVDMATTLAVLAPATVTGAVVSCGSKTRQRTPKVVYIGGMRSYEGLKTHNEVVSIGLPVCTQRCFTNVVSPLKAHGKRRIGGGALSSTCNEAAEIFKIAAIMNGLVLVGVAVGFVLLRIEASVEESEQRALLFKDLSCFGDKKLFLSFVLC
ncbi:hypothetical protein CRYUN_Cryun27aG0089700 [Craigia yunnanensis]